MAVFAHGFTIVVVHIYTGSRIFLMFVCAQCLHDMICQKPLQSNHYWTGKLTFCLKTHM